MPPAGTSLFPPEERVNGSAVPAALDAAGEVDPNPGVGRDAAGRQPGLAKGGTGHPDWRPGFLYPLLRHPLTFRSAAQRSFAAKARGTQLRPRYHPWLFNAVWGWLRARFPRIQVRGSGVTGYNWLLGTLRRAGCPAPPPLTVCTDLQRRHEVMPPYGSRTVTTLTPATRPAAHCYARQITQGSSSGAK